MSKEDLDAPAGDGFLEKVWAGWSNYYVNLALVEILTEAAE